MRRAWSCSASTFARVDLPTRMGPSTTMWRGDLKLGLSVFTREIIAEAPNCLDVVRVLCRFGCALRTARLAQRRNLPGFCDYGDDASERIHVASIDHFGG